MPASDHSRNEHERQLNVIVARYYRAADGGHPPDQDEFVAQHPEYEQELLEFFADVNQMQEAIPQPTEDAASDDEITLINSRSANRAETFVPRSFGEYEILEVLGAGGMGVVYKARQKHIGRVVALKMIRAGQLATPQDVQRFQLEVRAHARLSHPGIVAVHEAGSIDGQHFFTMEYLAGGSLSSLHRDQPVSSKRAAKLVRRLAESMHYAHTEGVFHRDLKPANILLGAKGAPRITDFGLAMLQRKEEETQAVTMTETGQILGTAGYMSPEQALGKKNSVVDARSDVYSLGAVLYALLTSRAPFVGESVSDTLLQVIQSEPVSPRVLNPSVPADLETICLKCLEKDQDKRIQTAQALSDELKRFIEGRPISIRPCGSIERTWRWSRRNPAITRLLGMIVLCLLIGIGVSGYFAYRSIQLDALNRQLSEKIHNVDAITASLELTRKDRDDNVSLAQYRQFLIHIEEARATLRSGRPGQSLDAWDAVISGSELQEQLQLSGADRQSLRDQAIASLALVDLERVTAWSGELSPATDIALSNDLDRMAFGLPAVGGVLVRRLSSEIADRLEIPTTVTANNSFFRFSPDNKWLSSFDYSLRSVRFLNVQQGSESEAVSAVSSWSTVDFHPTRPLAIVGQSSGTLLQFDLTSGQSVPFVVAAAPGSPSILSVRYSPDGQRIAVCRSTGLIEIHSAETTAIELQFSVPAGANTLAWRPDGASLAVGVGVVLQVFDLTDSANITMTSVCHGREAGIIEIHWHSALPLVASSSQDGTSRLWDADSGRQLLQIAGTMKGFHRDGTSLAIRLPRSVEFYRFRTAEVLTRLDRGSTGSIAIHPAEQLVAAIDPDGVRVLDLVTKKTLFHLPIDGITGLIFHPKDGSLVTSGASGVSTWPIVRSTADSVTTLRVGPPVQLENGLASTGTVRTSTDGNTLLVADGGDQGAWVLDRGGSRPQVPLPVPSMASMDISSNGQWAAAGDELGEKVSVWNTQTGQLEEELPFADGFPFLRFSPDGKWLAASGLVSASIWKVEDWSLSHTIPLNCHGPAAIAFSPDSTLIAIGRWGDSTQLYDVTTATLLASLESPHLPVTFRDMVFSSDGRHLICSTDREGTCVWDIARIRSRLSEVNLDWGSAPLPEAAVQPVESEFSVEVDLGQLTPVTAASGSD